MRSLRALSRSFCNSPKKSESFPVCSNSFVCNQLAVFCKVGTVFVYLMYLLNWRVFLLTKTQRMWKTPILSQLSATEQVTCH